MRVCGLGHSSAALPPGKRPGTQYTGDWVGLKDGLDVCGKSRPPPGFGTRTVQSVVSRYTEYAIAAIHRKV